MDKLSEIMLWKRREIADRVRPIAPSELIEAGKNNRSGSFLEALVAPEGLAVISEIKRQSPSAGPIKELKNPFEQAEKYREAGADCLSILTDEKYFGGSLSDLQQVTDQFHRNGLGIPCLRKDFMIHPVQVLEAAQTGAAAILIIVRALDDDEMKSLREAADLAGLDALYEIHSESELERAITHNARIIGVNNRDLAVFKTDLAYSEKLIPAIPRGILPVSESGIWNRIDASRARAAGAKAILVGEALMKAESASNLIRDFHSA